MTAAYLRETDPATTRVTSNYTLTVETDNFAVLDWMQAALGNRGLIRTASISDRDAGRVGVSWRSPSDEAAAAVARYLLDAAGPRVKPSPRLWTGFGIHTREVPVS